MHKSQILFYILSFFVLGVFMGSFWTISQIGILLSILLGTIVLVVSGYQGTFGEDKKGMERRRKGILAGFLILIFTLGIFRFNQFNSDRNVIRQFTDNIIGGKGVNYSFGGYVAGDPENKGDQTKFIFRIKRIIAPGKEIDINDDVLVTANLSDIKYEDGLIITGSLMTPKNFNEDFDYVNYLKKDGIRTLINYPKNITKDGEPNGGIYKYIFAVKNKFESAIN